MKIVVLSVLLLAGTGFWYVSGTSETHVQSDGSAFPEAAPRDPEENISGEVAFPAAEENFIEEGPIQTPE